MARKREVTYFNGRLKGSLTEEQCKKLETIIQLKNENGCIDKLKHTIFDLEHEDVEKIIESKGVFKPDNKPLGTLTDNQTLSVAFLFFSKSALLGDSVGLGKTICTSALLNISRREKFNKFGELYGFRYLFLTEKSLMEQAREELIRFTGEYVDILYADKKSVSKFRKEAMGLEGGLVAPHSLFNQEEFHAWLRNDLQGGYNDGIYDYFDFLIIDESSVLGNIQTKFYKNAELLQGYFRNAVELNAQPFESGLKYMYGQLNFLDNTFLPTKTAFEKEYYCYDYSKGFPQHNGKYKNAAQFKHLVGYRYFYQTRKQLGAEIKNVNTQIKRIPLSKQQKRLMKESQMYRMIYDIPTVIDNRIPFNEETTPKLKLLKQIIEEEIPKKEQILISAHYKESHKYLKEWFQSKGYSVEVLNGEVKNNERFEIINNFKKGNVQVLITNVQKGLNFAGVKNVIFYAYMPNPSKMIQLEGRVTRTFDIKDKRFWLLVTEGRELETIKTTLTKQYKSSAEFSNDDISAIGDLLIREFYEK